MTETVSKTELAERMGVSQARVSQLIKDGKIPADALDGEGRRARIILDKALAALRVNLDVDQSLSGNGKARKAMDGLDVPPVQPTLDSVPSQMEAHRLRQAEIKTAQMEREEKLAIGQYILADDAEARISRAAAQVINAIESRLADMADALAAEFQIPRRDTLILLQQRFREIRTDSATAFRKDADAAAQTTEIENTDS